MAVYIHTYTSKTHHKILCKQGSTSSSRRGSYKIGFLPRIYGPYLHKCFKAERSTQGDKIKTFFRLNQPSKYWPWVPFGLTIGYSHVSITFSFVLSTVIFLSSNPFHKLPEGLCRKWERKKNVSVLMLTLLCFLVHWPPPRRVRYVRHKTRKEEASKAHWAIESKKISSA